MLIRVKPVLHPDDGCSWAIGEGSQLHQVDDQRERTYSFDRVFGPNSSTEAVYNEGVRGLITDFVSGFNSTVFAYGQTGSGKTHSLLGTPSSAGVITMAVKDIFDYVEEN